MKTIIGVDEVGMGCLAGPVVVCAVQVPLNLKIGDFGVQDSKLVSPKQREAIVAHLSFPYHISWCYPKTIDRLNIFGASRVAMRRAVQSIGKDKVFVDGPHRIPGLAQPQQAIVKGDQKIFAIAAASILAKVYRDNMMMRYAKRFPQYGFEKHKGYGTKLHLAMLALHGISPIHRASFAPVRKMS